MYTYIYIYIYGYSIIQDAVFSQQQYVFDGQKQPIDSHSQEIWFLYDIMHLLIPCCFTSWMARVRLHVHVMAEPEPEPEPIRYRICYAEDHSDSDLTSDCFPEEEEEEEDDYSTSSDGECDCVKKFKWFSKYQNCLGQGSNSKYKCLLLLFVRYFVNFARKSYAKSLWKYATK